MEAPEGFREGLAAFEAHQVAQGYAAPTIVNQVRDAIGLARFLRSQGAESWSAFTPELAREYQIELLDRPWIVRTRILTLVRRVGEFLVQEGVLLTNPATGLKKTPVEMTTPIEPLDAEEVRAILCAPDVTTRIGMRDHAILHLIYETAVNFTDACKWTLDDLTSDLTGIMAHGVVVIRVVRLSEETQASLRRYLDHARPHLARFDPEQRALFVSPQGKPLGPQGARIVWKLMMARHLKRSRVLKSVRCHSLRWARIVALADQGLPREELVKLAGYESSALARVLKRAGR